MTILLAGDIGGTKVDLQLVESTQDASIGGIKLHELHYERYQNSDYQCFDQLVKEFLTTAEVAKYHHPEQACFAVAGPVA
ncbi:MAG: glucokinase, partial [Candidatus Electrothrix sp. ATG2]|nr:glucokinase [Candidatus Electrothrix sp. ATG2]